MEDTKHSAAQVLPPRAQTRTAAGCGTRHCCILYTLSIAVRNLTAQSCSKAQLARRARAVQQSAARRTRVRVKRHRRDTIRPHCCERVKRQRCTPTSATAERRRKPAAGSRRRAPARLPPGRAGPTSSPGSRQSRSSSGSVWKSTSASGAPDKSFLGDDAAVLARSSGEEPTSPRQAGVAS